MTWRGYVLVLAILSLIAGGWWAYDKATTPPLPFPPEVQAIVRHADRARAQEMRPLVGSPQKGAAFFENCSMVGVGKAVEPKPGWLSDFRNIVLDGRTYVPEPAMGTPTPRMVVRFAQGDQKVDVMLDFDINAMVVQMDGKPCGTGEFTARREDLVRLAKVMFPDSREVQSLPSSVN